MCGSAPFGLQLPGKRSKRSRRGGTVAAIDSLTPSLIAAQRSSYPRSIEALPITDDLRRALLLLRRHQGMDGPAELEASSVRDVEEAVGTRIPAAVLAYLAATARSPGELVTLSEELDAFHRAEGDPKWQTHSGFAHVPYDAWGEWPRYYVCLSRGRGGGEAVIWNLKTAAIDALPGAPDLLRYLRFRWGEAIDFDEPVAAAELASFVPAIGERQAVVKRARHATFGIGTITRELGDKLEIDFGEQGTKLLLRRFIEEV